MVSFLPVWLGHLLATRELVPGLGIWTGFWAQATTEGATSGAFWAAFGAWWATADVFLLALVVTGPLLWLATLLINDVHDLPGDRLNPRKARSPLVQGLVAEGRAHRAAYVSAAIALAVAAFVGTAFMLLILVALVLAWAYSVPPVRLKTRPGGDLAVNAVGVGLVSALAGWSITAPLAAFPWLFVPQGLLVAIAAYAPTTVVDHDADRAIGYTTLATHLGPARALAIGWWAWVASHAGALALAWNGWILPHAMFPLLVVFTPILLIAYRYGILHADTPEEMVQGIVLTTLPFAGVNAVFALMYTGLWTT